MRAAAAHQMIASASGGFSIRAPGGIMSAVAIANPSPATASVQLTVTSLAGSVAGSASVQLDAGSRRALFLDELFAGRVAMPFEGTLSINSSIPIAAAGLRAQYNERDDFLISGTPVFGEMPGSVFAHVVDGAGYSMRFVFVARPDSNGAALRLFDQNGAPLFIEVRD